VLQGGAI
jgi:hypothetical protein